MFGRKTILAKLLANENIIVQQGNFQTASFDPKGRVLSIPVWENISNDMMDLLIGHEVGHALWTPESGWTDIVEESKKPGAIPVDFYNIVEDVRIERLIIDRYPGLYSNFIRGYEEFVERKFFTDDEDKLNAMGFMDRLNVQAKLRKLVNVKFDKEEQVFVDRSYKTETWGEVVQLTKDIFEFLKNRGEDNGTKPTPDMSGSGEKQKKEQGEPKNGESGGDRVKSHEQSDEEASARRKEDEERDDFQMSEGNQSQPPKGQGQEPDKEQTGEGDQGDQKDSGDAGGDQEADNEEGESKGDTEGGQPDDGGDKESKSDTQNGEKDGFKPDVSKDFVIVTGKAMDKMQKENLSGTLYVAPPSEKIWKDTIVDYEEIMQQRKRGNAALNPNSDANFDKNGIISDFRKEMKRAVNALNQEFEMRKSAKAFKKVRISDTGTIDTRMLAQYKFNDNIFKQSMTLPKGKNHGVVMLVDFSGSMSNIINKVMRQVLILAQFCRVQHIPHRIYGFTSGGNKVQPLSYEQRTSIDYSSTRVFPIIDSTKGDKSEKEMIDNIINQYCSVKEDSQPKFMTKSEAMGSTPLNTSLLLMEREMIDFQKNFSVEKLTLIVMTDGASNSDMVRIGEREAKIGKSNKKTYNPEKIITEIFGKNVVLNFGSIGFHRDIIDAYSKEGVKTIHFDIQDSMYSWMVQIPQHEKQDAKFDKNGMRFQEKKDGYDWKITVKSSAFGDKTPENSSGQAFLEASISNAKKYALIAKKFGQAIG